MKKQWLSLYGGTKKAKSLSCTTFGPGYWSQVEVQAPQMYDSASQTDVAVDAFSALFGSVGAVEEACRSVPRDAGSLWVRWSNPDA